MGVLDLLDQLGEGGQVFDEAVQLQGVAVCAVGNPLGEKRDSLMDEMLAPCLPRSRCCFRCSGQTPLATWLGI